MTFSFIASMLDSATEDLVIDRGHQTALDDPAVLEVAAQ